MVGAELDNIVIYILESKLCDIQLFLCNQRLTKKLKIITVALIEQITCLSIYKINPVRSHRSIAKKETVVHLFNRSKDHGSGCATALNTIHCSLYHVYCLTQSTTLLVTIHKSCTDQRWKGYQNSARIQDQRSTCW